MLQFPIHTDFRLTSKFGARRDPFTGSYSGHNGIDLAIPVNTPIYSPAAGVVTSSFTNSAGGNQMIIDHGNIKTGYAHLNSKLKKGARVKKNDLIAYSGNTGRSTGPHLHLTTKRNDKLIDPLSLSWQLKPAQKLKAPKEIKTTNRTGLIIGALSLAALGTGVYFLLKDK